METNPKKPLNRSWIILLVVVLAAALISACAGAPASITPPAVRAEATLPASITDEPAFATPVPAATQPAAASDDGLAASLNAFGRVISIAEFEPTLAQGVSAAQVEAVLPDPNQMVYAAHPAYADFKFTGYVNERKFQLPFPIETARVMVYPTAEFNGFSSEAPTDYPNQALALEALLRDSPDFSNCDKMSMGYSDDLPFLPMVNSAQVFCSRPKIVPFEGGMGIRYLTYYAQGMNPVQDWEVFYTFQGLTSDGQYYISALFPIRSGVFPYESGEVVMEVGDAYRQKINEQLAEVKALEDGQFMPPLADLDALVAGIAISEP